MMQFKTVLGTGMMTALALTSVAPAIAQSLPFQARNACIQRTAEEMGVATRDVSLVSSGPVSAESGAVTLFMRNNRTGQTAECRVNTIDNTVLSVTMNSGVPSNNFGQRPEFWIVKPSGSFLKAEPNINASSIRNSIPGNTVFRNLGCQSQRFPTWCEVELRDNPQVRGWAFSTTFSEYRTSSPRGDISRGEAPEVGTPVSGLSDLVGARAGQAENTIKLRGYRFLRSQISGDAPYSYWREPRTNYCVVIRTANGRYESIVYGSPSCN